MGDSDSEQDAAWLDEAPQAARDLARRLLAPRHRGDAKVHHLVPKFYLDRFADERGRICVARRADQGQSVATRSTTKVAVETGFYSVETEEGEEMPYVERLMSEIEGAAAKAIARTCSNLMLLLTPDQKIAISMFLGLQHTRGRRMRRRLEAQADMVTKILLADRVTPEAATSYLRSQGGADPTDEEIAGVIAISSELDKFDVATHPNEHMRTMLEVGVEQIGLILSQMSWALGRFDAPVLMTGDHPVSLYVCPKNRNPLVGVGIATADEIWCPLDPRHVLMMTKDPIGDRLMHVDSGFAAAINQNTLAYSYEEVYFTPGLDPLASLTWPPAVEPLFMADGLAHQTDGVNAAPERIKPRRRRR